jgi:hypothetical protein
MLSPRITGHWRIKVAWGIVAVGVASAVGSYAQSSASAGAAAQGADAQNRQVLKHNEAVVASNIENTVRTGFRVGLLNMQRGQARVAAVERGHDITSFAQQALSSASANAAAAGTVGASVEAVEADIYQKVGEEQSRLQRSWSTELLNFDTELHNLVTQGKDTIRGADGEVAKVDISQSKMIGQAVLAGAVSAASNYAMRNMSLGLGQSTAAPVQQLNVGATGLSSGGFWLGGGGAPVRLPQ